MPEIVIPDLPHPLRLEQLRKALCDVVGLDQIASLIDTYIRKPYDEAWLLSVHGNCRSHWVYESGKLINITTKKQEYGVLQAVGMTNKQLNLSLQIQGLIFTVGTICVALAAGLPLGYALFSYAKHNGIFGMNVYHVPLIPILAMILLVGLLQIVLSLVLSSNLKKETLVERIWYQG